MARPQVRQTFTADHNGVSKRFRVVQDDAAAPGSYTLETAETDAVGATSWQTFVRVTSNESDRSQTKLTPGVLTALLDSLYTA